MRILCMMLAVTLSGATWAEIVIHAGKMADASTGDVREAVTIVVDGERIKSVESGYQARPTSTSPTPSSCPAGSTCTCTSPANRAPTASSEGFTLEPADYALRAVPYAERTLMAGFTTVRDVGTAYALAQSIRRAVNEGHIPGPRIYTSGKSLATTGGHADPTNGVIEELRGDPGPADGVVNGVDDAYKAVRALCRGATIFDAAGPWSKTLLVHAYSRSPVPDH